MMDGATQMLKRAVELDNKECYSEAKVCYEEGIELLMKSLLDITGESIKIQIRTKISTYMKRAEQLKSHMQKFKKRFHEKIEIVDNQRGCSYATLFSKYINDKLTDVTIYDAYIRSHHQILNLLRFCELLVKKGKSIKNIHLTTGRRLYFCLCLFPWSHFLQHTVEGSCFCCHIL